MIKSLVSFLFLLNACASENSAVKENRVNVETAFFEDINLFALEGVRKISLEQPLYPYVQIANINDTARSIIYHASGEVSYRRDYTKEKNYWSSSFSSNGDTCLITTYEYVTSNMIMTFHYCSNDNIKNAVLADVIILEGSTETFYDMGNEPDFKPDINAIDLVRKKSKSIFVKEITITNGILTIHERTINGREKKIDEQITRYKIGNHSYFWWRYFGWTLKK